MPQQKDKYSLWVVPHGEPGEAIQALVDELADGYNAPRFVPHISLVANIFADSTELEDVLAQVQQCAEQLSRFTVTLTEYGYLDETHRCLYLLAESPQLTQVYKNVSAQFPQISKEHFQAMPHMSVLYGNYPEETKKQIIAANPLSVTTFEVDSLDLFHTNDPTENWRLITSFELGTN